MTTQGAGADREALRALAEAVAAGRADPSTLSASEVRDLARELAVHRGELSLQREELARQQAEIERARLRYRSLFERAPVGYMILDADGMIEDANDAALALLGRRRGELHQQELAWFVAPPQREAWALALASAADGQRPACELDVLKGDGAAASVRVEVATLPRAGDDPRVLLTVSDNRAREEAERAVRASESHYRQLFDVSPAPKLLVARDGLAVLAANAAAERAFGCAGDDLRAASLADLACAEDAPALAAWLAGGARGRCERPLRFRRPGGALVAIVSAHDVTFRARPAVLIAVDDVTERWSAERELHRANELLRAVIDASPMGIVAVGASGEVRIANGAAGRIFGRDCEAAVGAAFVECFRAEGMAAVLLQALEGREVHATDLAVYPEARPGASSPPLAARHLTVSAAPIRNAEGRAHGAIVVVADVTSRRLLEDQLRQSHKLRAIGQLAGGIAHDFNNLLTVILGCATTIREHLPPESPVIAEAHDVIAASRRAARLTQRLLAFSRRHPGDSAVVAVDATVRDWVEHILRHTIPESIEFEVRLDAADACIDLDPSQFQQVLLNLVLNARDAMPLGGRVVLRTGRDDGPQPPLVYIEVEDTGMGMAPEVLERIFEPFYTTKEPDRGTGLGLSTVYGIVQQGGGEIAVDSVPGRGTRFRVVMPRAERTSIPTAPPPRITAAPGGECVLVVEDDEIVRRAICRGIAHLGFRVLDADGLDRAMELCRAYGATIRVLLTDVVMPGANGIDVAREVRRAVPGIEVIFMSGYTDEAFTPLEMRHEIGAILPKPFTAEEAAARIRETLARASQPFTILPLRVPVIGAT